MNDSVSLPPDRYNALGEWKPLIYPGNADDLIVPITRLTDDEEIQGTLLYVKATGKLVAEFVVRTSLRFPSQPYSLQPNIHLWACPLPIGTTINNQNVIVYDGWMNLSADTPESIREAVDLLRQSLHRLAFAFQASITWRLKYLPSHHASGIHQPGQDEFHAIDWLFHPTANIDEARILDAAIDWYNTGSTSSNPLTRFLCYFIALESVAIAVTDGDVQFGLTVPASTTSELRGARVDCIKALARELLESEPVSFVTTAYFECVQTLSKRLRIVMELVFGLKHPYLDLLFSRSSGPSLADIRSKLAHGRLTLISPEDDRLIRANLFQMASIAHEFILRLCYNTTPSKPPSPLAWSGQFALEMSTTDPRTMLITSNLRMLPTSDWRIRPEWCDS